MGNAGITVYNDTNFHMTVYLSMGAIHHFCNDLKPKEAFTIYPGAVWYTVGCFRFDGNNRITNGQCAGEIVSIAVPAVLGVATGGVGLAAGLGSTDVATSVVAKVAAAIGLTAMGETVFGMALTYMGSIVFSVIAEAVTIGAATAGAAKGLFESFAVTAAKCTWDDDMKEVYCGKTHKILVIKGGLYIKNDEWQPENISIRKGTRYSIPSNTKFRKKNGLYNDDYEYWESSDGKWYPPRNFP